MKTSACPSYTGYRFPAEVISHAVWLYFRFPLSLQMVDELLAARGVIVSHETVRQWALKELCWNLGDAVIRRRSVLACW
jgi:putative transposase